MSSSFTSEFYADFLNCDLKFYLKSIGRLGNANESGQLETELQQQYRRRARRHLLSSCADGKASQSPRAVLDAIRQGYSLILDAVGTVHNL